MKNPEQTPQNAESLQTSDPQSIGNKTVDNYNKQIAAFREKHKSEAGEEIKYASEQIQDLEYDFRRKLAKLRENNRRYISREEYEIYENDYADYWRIIDSKMDYLDYHPEEREGAEFEAYYEAELFPDIDKADASSAEVKDSIEAQAGNFYGERSRALIRAIEASDSDTKEKDLAAVKQFEISIAEHIDYRNDAKNKNVTDWEKFDKERTKAHNDAIRHFNAINHLAKKYGTKPLFPRDFWTTQIFKDPTYFMDKKAHFDHYAFQAYYENAFDWAKQK
jgi:hypothetical protein